MRSRSKLYCRFDVACVAMLFLLSAYFTEFVVQGGKGFFETNEYHLRPISFFQIATGAFVDDIDHVFSQGIVDGLNIVIVVIVEATLI